jgi:hypothetical protein
MFPYLANQGIEAELVGCGASGPRLCFARLVVFLAISGISASLVPRRPYVMLHQQESVTARIVRLTLQFDDEIGGPPTTRHQRQNS